MKKVKTLIFDFDGTIGDTVNIILECLDEVSEKHNIPKYDKRKFIDARGHQLKDAIFDFLGIKSWQFWKLGIIPRLLKEGHDLFYQKKDKIKPIPGMLKVLKKLSANYEILVLSSNKKETIHSIFDKWDFKCHGIYHCFKLFGKHHTMKQIIKERGIKDHPERVIYVGDEIRDASASRRADIKMLAVTWGFNNKEAFLKAKIKANNIISKPEDILSKLK